MQFVQFYNQIGLLLPQQDSQIIINQVFKDYRINSDLSFKTPSFKYYKLIKDEDVETMRRFPHLVTISYGVNPIWLLYLTKSRNSQRKSYFINLITQQVIEVKFRCSSRLYRGTLIEGEFITRPPQSVAQTGAQTGTKFVILDLLATHRQSIMDQPMTQRLSSLRSIFDNHYQSDPLIEPLPLQMRPFAQYSELKSFIKNVVLLDPNHQGLLFIPNHKATKCYFYPLNNSRFQILPNQQGKQQTPKKELDEGDLVPYELKTMHVPHPSEFSEMTFLVTPHPTYIDNYQLYQEKNGCLYYLDTALVRQTCKSLELRDLFFQKKGLTIDGIKNLHPFKCGYVRRFRKWEPIELA